MGDLLLGIDVGTTATKAALITPEGRVQGVGQAGYDTHHIRPTWVEQHAGDWWQATCTAVRQALDGVPHGAERVAGVAVSSQAPTMLPLDRAGNPLRPALIWMDRRAEAEIAALRAAVGDVHRVTGNRPDAYYVAAKLRWFSTHEPERLAQTHKFVQANGYINYRLTGTFGIDEAHAALLQLRDYATGEWSQALCEACGVEPAHFPTVYPGHHVQGEVTAEAASATGLRPGMPVMAGTVDAAAAALEAGVIDPGTAGEMSGTSTVLMMPNEQGITEPAFIAMPHAVSGIHLLLGAMVASGANLRWYRDQFGAVEVLASARSNLDPFDLLTQQAAQIDAGSGCVIFLPYMMGERSPLWHTNARGVFFGLSLSTPRAALIRAIMEGAAFALKHNVDVAEQAGVVFNELRSVGGAARSTLWNQIKADVLGLPVLLPETAIGAPFGDAALVGMGLALYPDVRRWVEQTVKIRARFEPDPNRHARYQKIYPIFRSIYEHLRPDFDCAALTY